MFEIIKIDPLRTRMAGIFVELERKFFKECYTKILKKEEVKKLEERISCDFIRKESVQKNDDYYLIQSNEQYIGFFQTKTKDSQIEISKIYIEKKFRKKGIGYNCFLDTVKQAKKKKAKKIIMYVNEKFAKSEKNIIRWGFEFKELTARYLGSDIYFYENCYEFKI